MAQQLLTLSEIRTLLARQSDENHHSFDQLHPDPDDQHVSLEGGKGIVQAITTQADITQHDARIDDSQTSTDDVISSVRTIMASQMAAQQPIVVMAAEEPTMAGQVRQGEEEHHHHQHHGEEDHHHAGHHGAAGHHGDHHHLAEAVFEAVPADNVGLLATNQHQAEELNGLADASNRLAFQVWNAAIKERSFENNEVLSPLALTSALGVGFLGARGQTAEAIDAVLGLDRLTSRNPHLHLQQVSRDMEASEHFQSAVTHTVYVDESTLLKPAGKGPSSSISDIFRARVDTLYGASLAGNVSRVQELVKKSFYPLAGETQQPGPDDSDVLRPPFGIISTASLNVAWPSFTTHVQQEEEFLQFINLPSAAQVTAGGSPPPTARRLVPVPTIRTTGHFYAGYDGELDATLVALPLHPVREAEDGDEALKVNEEALDQAGHLSLIMILPGKAYKFQAGGSGLAELEGRLAERKDGWDHLLRQTKPHHLQVELPQLLGQQSRFSLAKPLSAAEEQLGGLFDSKSADFGGISSAIKPLYLADMVQMARLNISSVASLPASKFFI